MFAPTLDLVSRSHHNFQANQPFSNCWDLSNQILSEDKMILIWIKSIDLWIKANISSSKGFKITMNNENSISIECNKKSLLLDIIQKLSWRLFNLNYEEFYKSFERLIQTDTKKLDQDFINISSISNWNMDKTFQTKDTMFVRFDRDTDQVYFFQRCSQCSSLSSCWISVLSSNL